MPRYLTGINAGRVGSSIAEVNLVNTGPCSSFVSWEPLLSWVHRLVWCFAPQWKHPRLRHSLPLCPVEAQLKHNLFSTKNVFRFSVVTHDLHLSLQWSDLQSTHWTLLLPSLSPFRRVYKFRSLESLLRQSCNDLFRLPVRLYVVDHVFQALLFRVDFLKKYL